MLYWSPFSDLNFSEAKINAKLKFVISLGKVISIDHLTIPSEDVDELASSKVRRAVVLFSFETHARVDSVDSLFG